MTTAGRRRRSKAPSGVNEKRALPVSEYKNTARYPSGQTGALREGNENRVFWRNLLLPQATFSVCQRITNVVQRRYHLILRRVDYGEACLCPYPLVRAQPETVML